MVTFEKYELILETVSDEILKAIPKGGITFSNLQKALNREGQEISKNMIRLLRKGKIEKPARAVYIKKGDKLNPDLIPKEDTVLSIIPKGGISFKEIKKKTGLDNRIAMETMRNLIRRGKVEKAGKAVYIKKGDTVNKDVNNYIYDEVLKAMPKGGADLNYFVKKLNISKTNAKNNLQRLFNKGEIERVSKGVYIKKGDKADPKLGVPHTELFLKAIPKGGITTGEIIQKVNLPDHIVKRFLKKLKRDGILENPRHGIWIKKGDKIKEKEQYLGQRSLNVFNSIPKGGARVKDLANKLNMSIENTGNALLKLTKKDKVKKLKRGFYIKTEELVGKRSNVKDLPSIREKLLSVIPTRGTFKYSDIEDKLKHLNKKSAQNELTKLEKEGKLERVSHGVYKMKKGATIPSKVPVIKTKRKDMDYKYPQAPSIKWKTNIA
jgi:predicted transcriptional regulator